MGEPIVRFEIMAQDGGLLQEYYAQLFGWRITGPSVGYAFVSDVGDDQECNQRPLIGGIGTAPLGESGHVTFYVAVDDVEATLTEATKLGGARVVGPERLAGERGQIGQFRDPEGNLIGVVTRRRPQTTGD